MTSRIGVSDRIIPDIRKSIPTLWIGYAWDYGIWLEEAVDIRRNRPSTRTQNLLPESCAGVFQFILLGEFALDETLTVADLPSQSAR